MRARDIIVALLVIFSWAINLILQKIFSKQIPVEFFNLLRFVACIPLVFFFKRPSISIFKLLQISFFYNVLNFFLVGMAIQTGLEVGTLSFIYQTSSFFGVLFCFCLLNEIPKSHQILGMLVSLFGVALLFSNTILFSSTTWIALVFVLLAAASWGAGITLIKKYSLSCNLSATVWITTIAALPMVVLIYCHGGSKIFEESFPLIDTKLLLGVLYATFVANLLGNCLWFWLLKKYQSSLVTPFMMLMPPFSCLISYFWLDEHFSLLQMLAFAVIVMGLGINQNLWKGSKAYITQPSAYLWKKLTLKS